jgi:MarR family transcriptional regulator, temperature-dependent positive regulator of motility
MVKNARFDLEMEDAAAPGLIVLLTRLSKQVYRLADETLLGMGLKEYMTLTMLGDGVPQQSLAESLHMDENNLVLLLNSLEGAGLISRRRDPDDRRRHIVELTPRGRKALERAGRGMSSLEDRLLGALSPADRAALKRLVVRVLERSGEALIQAEPARRL